MFLSSSCVPLGLWPTVRDLNLLQGKWLNSPGHCDVINKSASIATPETQIRPFILIKMKLPRGQQKHFEVAPESHGNSATGRHRCLISALLDTINTKAWIHMRGSGSVVAHTYPWSCVILCPLPSPAFQPRKTQKGGCWAALGVAPPFLPLSIWSWGSCKNLQEKLGESQGKPGRFGKE